MTASQLADGVRAADPNASIWRYVEFWKLADLLARSALWFARATELGDDFEGSLPAVAPTVTRNPVSMEQISRVRRNLRLAVYLNCWSVSEHESVALWSQYGSRNSLAIRSTAGRLASSLGQRDPAIKIGLVDYIDYTLPAEYDVNQLETFYFRKRLSFEHEREIRGWTFMSGKISIGEPPTDTPLGILVPVDLDGLVDVRGPRASDAFLGAVQDLTRKYGHPWEVRRSSLDDPAIF